MAKVCLELSIINTSLESKISFEPITYLYSTPSCPYDEPIAIAKYLPGSVTVNSSILDGMWLFTIVVFVANAMSTKPSVVKSILFIMI